MPPPEGRQGARGRARSAPSPRPVALVVVTYNSADVLPGLLDSLDTGMSGTLWHLVVVDNDSRDGSADVAERLAPGATVVRTGRNGGYAAGINAGIGAAGSCAAVLILNADVRLEPGCAATLLAALERPGVCAVAPRLEDRHGRLVLSIRREPTLARAVGDAVLGARRVGRSRRWGELVTDPTAYTSAHIVDWTEGSTLMVSKECLDRVGSWDESFFLYSEETDFALRARDAGSGVWFVPAARAVHLEGGSSGSVALWPLLVANKWRLYRKRHGRMGSTAFWGVLVFRETSRAAAGHRESRAALRYLLSRKRMSERPGPQSIR